MATQMRYQQAKVEADGRLQLPEEVRERAGIKPGDDVFCWSDGEGRVYLRRWPTVTPQELFERYGNPDVTELDWTKLREEAEEDAAQEFLSRLHQNG